MKMNKVNKEIITYVIFGVLTTIVNFVVYGILIVGNIDYRISTTIAFIISILFAYITNKIYVFNSKTYGTIETIVEFIKFLLSRVITYIVDIFGLIILIEIVQIDSMVSKVIINIVVIILNYILSKIIVFQNKKS